jgi:hypothetical protein
VLQICHTNVSRVKFFLLLQPKKKKGKKGKTIDGDGGMWVIGGRYKFGATCAEEMVARNLERRFRKRAKKKERKTSCIRLGCGQKK